MQLVRLDGGGADSKWPWIGEGAQAAALTFGMSQRRPWMIAASRASERDSALTSRTMLGAGFASSSRTVGLLLTPMVGNSLAGSSQLSDCS